MGTVEVQVTNAGVAESERPIIGSMAFIYMFIAIAVLLLCVCLCFGIYCFYSKKKIKQINNELDVISSGTKGGETQMIVPSDDQTSVTSPSDIINILQPLPKQPTVSTDSVGWTAGFIGAGSLANQDRNSMIAHIAEGKHSIHAKEGGPIVANE